MRRRNSSPIHSTIEVPAMMIAQSSGLMGVTLNILPPTVTINTCPTSMITAISPKPLQPLKWNAERPVLNARALNIFQNCSITNMVKNILNS